MLHTRDFFLVWAGHVPFHFTAVGLPRWGKRGDLKLRSKSTGKFFFFAFTVPIIWSNRLVLYFLIYWIFCNNICQNEILKGELQKICLCSNLCVYSHRGVDIAQFQGSVNPAFSPLHFLVSHTFPACIPKIPSNYSALVLMCSPKFSFGLLSFC